MLSRILRLRAAKRTLLAGLLLALQNQIGSAQEFQGIFARPGGAFSAFPGCGRPHQAYPPAMPVAPPLRIQPLPTTPDGKTPEAKTPEAKADSPPAAQPNMNPQDFQPITASALGDTQFAMAAPQIMGDFAGYSVRRTFFVPVTVTQTTTIVDNTSPPPVVTTSTVVTARGALLPVTVVVPVPGRAGSGFKIADDESPIPRDRVFFSYNYFDGLRGQGGANPGMETVTVSRNGAFITTVNQVLGPATINAPTANLHREIFGFEKTFLDGDASIEVRLPIFQSTTESFGNGGFARGGFASGGFASGGFASGGFASGGFAGDDFGDATTVLKFALVNDRDRVYSVGLATTFPTGPAVTTDQGSFRSVLLQPFVGLYRGSGDFFVQGFTSVLASTSRQDATLLFNDYAVGYRLYKADRQFVRSISPVLEVHVTTPLGGASGPIVVPDIVSFTGGLHLGLGANSTLSFGCNVPMTGARPYNAEALVQLNYRL